MQLASQNRTQFGSACVCTYLSPFVSSNGNPCFGFFACCKLGTLFIIQIRNAASSSTGASMGCYPRICSPLWLDHVVQSISMSAIPSVTSESVSSATSAESAHAKNGSEIPFTREMNDSESLTSLQFQSRVERLDRAPDMRLSRSIAERAGAGYATQQEYCWASR